MGKQVAARLNEKDNPNGGVAQLGEHLPCKQGVKSSNLSISIHQEIFMFPGVLYLENFIQRKELRRYQRKKTMRHGRICGINQDIRERRRKYKRTEVCNQTQT